MAALIYTLCALTSLACSLLLWRAWRKAGHRLLFWSALCFFGLTLNNSLLVLDKVIYADVDLLTWRLTAALIAVLMLLYGLIWEEE
jgi:hypothetical protein